MKTISTRRIAQLRLAQVDAARHLPPIPIPQHRHVEQPQRILLRPMHFTRQHNRARTRAKQRPASRGKLLEARRTVPLPSSPSDAWSFAARQNHARESLEILWSADKCRMLARASPAPWREPRSRLESRRFLFEVFQSCALENENKLQTTEATEKIHREHRGTGALPSLCPLWIFSVASVVKLWSLPAARLHQVLLVDLANVEALHRLAQFVRTLRAQPSHPCNAWWLSRWPAHAAPDRST